MEKNMSSKATITKRKKEMFIKILRLYNDSDKRKNVKKVDAKLIDNTLTRSDIIQMDIESISKLNKEDCEKIEQFF